MKAIDREPIGKVCRLLVALLRERELTYAEAGKYMRAEDHRVREIVREVRPHVPWVVLGKRGRRHVLRARGVGATDATLEVGIAACLGASVGSLLEGTRYHAGMRAALQFVVSTSPNPARFTNLDRRFLFLAGAGETALAARSEMLDRVARAVLEGRSIEFEYHGFDEADARIERAEPWSIAIHKGRLYLIGRARNKAVWVWRFARMEKVRTLRTKPFTYPTVAEYNPSRLFAQSFGIWLQPKARTEDVEVLLSRRWRAYARAHRWHPSQPEPIELADGRISIQMKVKLCRELKEWILGFGADAEVVRPRNLRLEIAQELRDAAAQYQGTEPPSAPRPECVRSAPIPREQTGRALGLRRVRPTRD